MSIHMDVRTEEPLEDGSYAAILKSIEKKETVYGQRLMWLFEEVEHGTEVAGFTSLSPSTMANAYIWAKALIGEIDAKKGWSSEDAVGKRCTIVVEVYEDAKGRTKNKVVRVKPPKK